MPGYDSLSAGQFTNAEVMAELDRAGPYVRRGSQVMAMNEGAAFVGTQPGYAGVAAQEAYRGYTVPGSMYYEQQGAIFDAIDANHDGKVSRAEFEEFQRRGSVQGCVGATQVVGGTQYVVAGAQQFAGAGQQVVGGMHYVAQPVVSNVAYVAPAQCVGTVQLPLEHRQVQQQYVAATQVAAAAPYTAPAQYVAPAKEYVEYAYAAPAKEYVEYAAPRQVQQQQYQMQDIFEGAVDVYATGEKRVVQEGVVDAKQQVISGVRPIYTFEKVVEVPQVIVREYEREVIKPQLIERIIEVPKTEIHEREVVGPPTVQVKEQIVEIPEVHIEERVVHVPRREIQERLIEIPKVEYVERIEYDDFIEYREVVVDKIVEVPEIEYHIREVEHLVPQTYIQEYYIDRYAEVPATQVQEVQRREEVPFNGPPATMQAAGQYMRTQAEAMSQMAAARGMQGYSSQLYGSAMEGSQWTSDYGWEQSAGQTYANYDPSKPGESPNFCGYGSNYGYAGYCGGSAAYNDGACGAMAMQANEQIEAQIASMPIGSTIAVPKGTVRQGGGFPGGATPPGSMSFGMPPGTMLPGSMPPGSMQGIPGYGAPNYPPPPTGSMPYTQSGPSDYNPFATSRPPVPAF